MAWMKKAYLYAVCLITLTISVIGAITFINYALNTWVIKDQFNYGGNPSHSVAMIIVGVPLFLVHWHYARKEA